MSTQDAPVKNDILTAICHDLKAPLCSIQALVQNIDKSQLNPKQLHQLKLIECASLMAAHQVDDVLDQEESHGREFFDPMAKLGHIIDILRAQHPHPIEWSKTNKPMTIESSLSHYTRICVNLINNALKYATGDVITIRAYYLLESAPQLKLIVMNHVSDSTEQNGHGLGLGITQKLVKHLKGTLQIESDPTTFKATLTLPIKPVESHHNMHHHRLLVLEDDAIARLAITESLIHHHITTCCYWDEAEKALAQGTYDAFITDLNLTDITPELLLKRLNQLPIPVLIISASKHPLLHKYPKLDRMLKPIDGTSIETWLEVRGVHLPLWDIGLALSRANQNPSIVLDMHEAFYKDLKYRISEIEQTSSETLLQHEIHTLVGGLAFLGLPRLEWVAKRYLQTLERGKRDASLHQDCMRIAHLCLKWLAHNLKQRAMSLR